MNVLWRGGRCSKTNKDEQGGRGRQNSGILSERTFWMSPRHDGTLARPARPTMARDPRNLAHSWKDHVNTISAKISKSIGIFYRAKLIISRKQLNQLYFLFVRSYLNYANIAWSSTRKPNCLLFIANKSTQLDY